MGSWLRRARGVLVMGLVWAGGGFAIGGAIELLANILPAESFRFASRVDMWPQTLAIPGFIGGVIFATVLMIVGHRRRFEQLSMPMFVGLGALAGTILGGIALTIGAPLTFIAVTAATGAVGGALSLAFARRADKPNVLGTRPDARELPADSVDEA